MNDEQNAIYQHMMKLVDGKKITKHDKEIYQFTLAEEFKRNLPEKALRNAAGIK